MIFFAILNFISALFMAQAENYTMAFINFGVGVWLTAQAVFSE